MAHDPLDLLAVELMAVDPSERISLVATLLKKCLVDVVEPSDEFNDDFDDGLTAFLNDIIADHGPEQS